MNTPSRLKTIQDSVRSDPKSVLQIAKAVQERFQKYDAKLNSRCAGPSVPLDVQAQTIVSQLEQGIHLPLAGVPVLIKDNICVQDEQTTAGSRILANYKSPFDATVVRKLREAGALLAGKANCDEFAMGSTTETSCYGPTANPIQTEHVPGGSSGGSAAAVGAGLVPVSLGSDTGGSIRQPASFCGCVGFKPTYGLVSRYGLIAYGSSLDQIGPFAKCVDDAKQIHDVISGSCRMDSTSLNEQQVAVCRSPLEKDISQLNIGILEEQICGDGFQKEVSGTVSNALDSLKSYGIRCETVSISRLHAALSAYYIIATSEASSNLSRFDGVRFGYTDSKAETINEVYVNSRSAGFGSEVKRRIMLGTFALSSGYYDAYYGTALKARTYLKDQLDHAFQKFDFLVSATSPTLPFRLGEMLVDPIAMYQADKCSVLANLAGVPAISIPCGTANGFSVGMQIIGPKYADEKLFGFAKQVEQWFAPLNAPVEEDLGKRYS